MSRAENDSRMIEWPDELGKPEARAGFARLGLVSLNGLGLMAMAILALAWFSDEEPRPDSAYRQVFQGEPDGGNISLAASPDGKSMATTDSAGHVALWRTNEECWSKEPLEIDGYANMAAFSPDGRLMATGGKSVMVWDLDVEGARPALNLPFEKVEALAFSPDGGLLALTFEHNGEIILWDLVEGRQKASLRSETMSILSVSFSPDGGYLASGGNSHISEITVWDLSTGEHRLQLKGPFGPIKRVAFSPDGTTLATIGAYERFVRLWDACSGRLLRTLAGHKLGTNGIAFSPDGTMLATVGNDGMGRLWTVATGELLTTLDGESVAVPGVAFMPDGLSLATTGLGDNDVRLWDLTDPLHDRGTQAHDPGRPRPVADRSLRHSRATAAIVGHATHVENDRGRLPSAQALAITKPSSLSRPGHVKDSHL